MVIAAGSAALIGHSFLASATEPRRGGLTFGNPAGVHRTVTMDGTLDRNHPFFEDPGANGRSGSSCHRPAQAWTFTPDELLDRFNRTAGRDPIFRTNDGSNCEGAVPASLGQRRRAFSLLLTKELIEKADLLAFLRARWRRSRKAPNTAAKSRRIARMTRSLSVLRQTAARSFRFSAGRRSTL